MARRSSWQSAEIERQIYGRQETIKLIEYRHAIVLGVGGIGSWVAFNLALSGQIKNLHLKTNFINFILWHGICTYISEDKKN